MCAWLSVHKVRIRVRVRVRISVRVRFRIWARARIRGCVRIRARTRRGALFSRSHACKAGLSGMRFNGTRLLYSTHTQGRAVRHAV